MVFAGALGNVSIHGSEANAALSRAPVGLALLRTKILSLDRQTAAA